MFDEYMYEVLNFLAILVLVMCVRRSQKDLAVLRSLMVDNMGTMSRRVDGLCNTVYRFSPVDKDAILEEITSERLRLFEPDWLKSFLTSTIHPYFSTELCKVYGLAKADEPPPDIKAPFLALSLGRHFIHVVYVDPFKRRAEVCAIFPTRGLEATRLMEILQRSS